MARPRTTRCGSAARLLTSLLAWNGCIASLGTKELQPPPPPQQQRRRVADEAAEVGGYKAVADLTSSNSTARNVAQFVVQHLGDLDQNQQSLDLGADVVGATADGNATVVVVRGYRQVVSGTNYRLLVMLMSAYIGNLEGCLGAFAVEVYVKWDGQKSITDWGRAVDCDVALELRDDPTLEYGPYHTDFQFDASSESIDDRLHGQDIQGSTSGGASASPLRGPKWFVRAAWLASLVGGGVAIGVSVS